MFLPHGHISSWCLLTNKTYTNTFLCWNVRPNNMFATNGLLPSLCWKIALNNLLKIHCLIVLTRNMMATMLQKKVLHTSIHTMPVLCRSPVKLIHVSFKNTTIHIINIHCSKRLCCKAHLTQTKQCTSYNTISDRQEDLLKYMEVHQKLIRQWLKCGWIPELTRHHSFLR